jgi:hypothetical protein
MKGRHCTVLLLLYGFVVVCRVVCPFGGWNPQEETEHICVGAGLNSTPTILF